MNEIPEDIRSVAEKLCNRLFRIGEHIDHEVHFDPAGLIAEALMAERGAQRDRVFTMLSGIADLLAKRMTDSATPELLKALASAVRASDEPEPSESIRSPDTGTP